MIQSARASAQLEISVYCIVTTSIESDAQITTVGVGAGEAISGFLKTHGVAGFAKQGMVAELTRGTFSRLVKFWVQPIAHENVFGMKQKDGNPLTKGLAGMLATVPEVVIISPIENIKLAEQLDKEKKFNGIYPKVHAQHEYVSTVEQLAMHVPR